jgi:precorrin-2 dehydrogenase/sirohydrochlorin ferrochelatase
VSLLPVALNLQNERVLVVGGGKVAARKTASLLECGARVLVVAPQLCEEFAPLLLQVEYAPRRFQSRDCDGCRLVFACTDAREVNEEIALCARAANAWCNIADDAARSDFHAAAAVRRGEICIGISTGGGSPAMARHLRARVEECVGAEYSRLLELMKTRRAELSRSVKNQPQRADMWRAILSSGALEALRRGDEADAQKRIEEIMDSE